MHYIFSITSHAELESVTPHMSLPFLIVKEPEVMIVLQQISQSDSGMFTWKPVVHLKSWKTFCLVKVFIPVWHTMSVGLSLPCNRQGVSLCDWLWPLKRIKWVQKNHSCTTRNDLHAKEFLFHPVFISTHKVQYDLYLRFKVELQVHQTPLIYFDD